MNIYIKFLCQSGFKIICRYNYSLTKKSVFVSTEEPGYDVNNYCNYQYNDDGTRPYTCLKDAPNHFATRNHCRASNQ